MSLGSGISFVYLPNMSVIDTYKSNKLQRRKNYFAQMQQYRVAYTCIN